MPKLTDAQIAGYAKAAGFRGTDIGVATAIAIAESNGNTDAYNGDRSTGDQSYGLWQINMLGTMGPERRAKYKLSKNEDLFNPATNARVAFGLFRARGNSWWDWSAFKTGKYVLYLVRGHSAAKVADPTVDSVLPDALEKGVGSSVSTVQTGEQILAFVTNKDNWLRVALFAGGALLVWVALLAYVRNTQAAETAIQIGKSFIPIGRAAKGSATVPGGGVA